MVEGGDEVCLEEEVERLRRTGMSADEISETMGVDRNWVETLISTWGEETSPEGRG